MMKNQNEALWTKKEAYQLYPLRTEKSKETKIFIKNQTKAKETKFIMDNYNEEQ